MGDEDKAREQLIDELVELRKRIAQLEASDVERKKAMAENEEKYRTIVENTFDVIYTCSSDGTITYLSPQASSMGFPPEKVVGRNMAGFIHPDDIDRVLSDLQMTMQTGSSFPTIFRVINADGRVIHVEETDEVIQGEEGIVGLRGTIRDISHRTEMEEVLQHRIEFGKLITTISTDFINLTSDKIDNGIEHGLQIIGEFAGVDRSYVFQLHDDGTKVDNTHEWCAEGIEPQIDNLKGVPVEAVPWWIEKLNRLEDIHIPRVADLPPEASSEREMLQAQDIRSLIVVPMVCSGNVIGFLGLDSVRAEKVWTEDAAALLRIVGEVFANSLERRRVEGELREHRDYLEELVRERTADLSKANEKLQQEIIERKQAEEEIRKSQERYVLATRAAKVGVWDWDVEHETFYLDPNVKIILGYSDEEIPNDLDIWATYVHPADRDPAMEAFQAHLDGKTPEYVCEHRMPHKDGSIRWIRARGTAIRGVQGDVSRVVGTDVDITEHKLAEEQLRQARREWEEIFQAIGQPAIILDPQHNVIATNHATLLAAGKSEEELLGKKCYEIFHSTEHPPEGCPMETMLDSGQLETAEMEMRAIAGSHLVSCTPVLDDTGQLEKVIHIATDITQRKQMEEELLKIEKLESVGVLAGGIAHDLNNLLTGVVGNISLARMYEDLAEKDGRLAEAEKASMRIKDLTQQLLTFSKGGAPILRTVTIGDLLSDSVTFALRGTNVRCEFFIPDDLWIVEIDEGQMNQVINNLAINAQQAMPEGGVVRISAGNIIIDATSSLSLAPGSYIKISIEDRGVGIPQEHLRRVFDPFFSTKQAGSGLGLATSFSIIQKHGGLITVESEVRVGTTFHIYLPTSSEKTPVVEEKDAGKPIIGEGNILVMDDEKHVRDTAGEMLSSLGYKATAAIDGAEALEIYKEAMESRNPFDAVIVDLTIPGGMGGSETIQRLLEIDPEVKAIVSSGYSNDPVLADFGEYGFKGVAAKPYKIRELSEILHKVIHAVA